jgi:integrase
MGYFRRDRSSPSKLCSLLRYPIEGREEGVEEGEKIKPVQEESVRATLPHLRPAVRAIVETLWWTGTRVGEIVLMRTCDIDRTGNVWTYRPMKYKTQRHGHERTILVGPEGQKVLSQWLKPDTPEAFLFSPEESEKDRYAERSQNRVTPRWPSHMYRNRTKRKKIPKQRPKARYTTEAVGRAITRA